MSVLDIGQNGARRDVDFINLLSPNVMPNLEIVSFTDSVTMFTPSILPLVRALSAYPINQVSIDMQTRIDWKDLSGPELVPFLKILKMDIDFCGPKELGYLKKFTHLKELRSVNFESDQPPQPNWLPPNVEHLLCAPSFFRSFDGTSNWLENIHYFTLIFDEYVDCLDHNIYQRQIRGLTNLRELTVEREYDEIEDEDELENFQDFSRALINKILETNKNITTLDVTATRLNIELIYIPRLSATKHLSLTIEDYMGGTLQTRKFIEKVISNAPLLESFSTNCNFKWPNDSMALHANKENHILSYPFFKQLVLSESCCLQTVIVHSNKAPSPSAYIDVADSMWFDFNEDFSISQFCYPSDMFFDSYENWKIFRSRHPCLKGIFIDLLELRRLLRQR